MFYRLMCWLGRCWRCNFYSTPEGVGGRCIDCGKIHGWATQAELVNYGRAAQMKQLGFK